MRTQSDQRPVNGKTINPTGLVRQVCGLPGNRNFIRRTRATMKRSGLATAVADRNNQVLYDWLMTCFSFQGVSDAIASAYIKTHGNANFAGLEARLTKSPGTCDKLVGFETFAECGYRKSQATCNRPKAISNCPLPALPLRKGQLNQAAFSLFLFIRDRCGGDLVGFIDRCLVMSDRPGHPDRVQLMRQALCDQLVQVVGVSHKLINMAFADLLVGADPSRSRWVEVGASMIAVDSLVHNFLRRTGIHHRYGTDHSFGTACYGPYGCAAILDQLARQIDCSNLNPAYPIYFPRFIQYAIWRFCSEPHSDICNGRNIDDQYRCGQKNCPIFIDCGRVALKPV